MKSTQTRTLWLCLAIACTLGFFIYKDRLTNLDYFAYAISVLLAVIAMLLGQLVDTLRDQGKT